MSRGQVSFGSIDLNAGNLDPVGGQAHANTDELRILLLADFSGRENCERNDPKAIASRAFVRVDRDNYEQVLERLAPRLDRTLLTGEGEHVSIEFKDLDSFHPDVLFDSLPIFESLRKLRRQLLNPNLCQHAIDEIESWQTGDITLEDDDNSAEDLAAEDDGPNTDRVTVDQLFDDVLEQPNGGSANVETQWKNLVSDLIEPYREKPVNPDRDKYVALVDEAIQRAMRSLLHHQHFSELEAVWRAVYQMVRRVETTSKLAIYLGDVSKTEVQDDLGAVDSLQDSALFEKLVRSTVGTPGGKPWNFVVSGFAFAPTENSVSTLGRLSKVVAAGQGHLFSDLMGGVESWCEPDVELPESWKQLMAMESAGKLSSFWPPYLARLPYGRKTSPTESFEFEEAASERPASDLLWAPAAILAVTSLAERFSRLGWQVDPTDVAEFSDMPMFLIDVDGEKEMHPCGKKLLTDEQLGRLVAAGVTPLVSYRGRNQVAFHGLQSIARKPVRFG